MATTNNGFYIYNLSLKDSLPTDITNEGIESSIIQKFYNEAENYVRTNQLYAAVRIHSGDYAFGTVHGGIVVSDSKGNITQVINSNRGLKKGIVTYLFEDNNFNLWATLNNGISLIDINTP